MNLSFDVLLPSWYANFVAFLVFLYLVVRHALPAEGMGQFESSFKTIDATNFQQIGNIFIILFCFRPKF